MLLFLFKIFDFCFLILAVITQTFNPVAKLVIPLGMPNKEAKSEMETPPLTIDIKLSKCST